MTKSSQKSWLCKAGTSKWLLRLLILLCLGLATADFVVHRHGYFTLEEKSGFYPIVGLITCLLIMGIASSVRFMVKRPEDYYDQ